MRAAAGVLFVGLLAVLAVVLLGFLSSGSSSAAVFDAGAVDSFRVATARHFDGQHFYLVRKQDGSFIALYDLDPHNQALIAGGSKENERCRLRMFSEPGTAVNDVHFAVANGQAVTVPGFENSALRDPCYGATFDLDGHRVFGPSPADLDSFSVNSTGASVMVDLGRRICARASPCISTR